MQYAFLIAHPLFQQLELLFTSARKHSSCHTMLLQQKLPPSTIAIEQSDFLAKQLGSRVGSNIIFLAFPSAFVCVLFDTGELSINAICTTIEFATAIHLLEIRSTVNNRRRDLKLIGLLPLS